VAVFREKDNTFADFAKGGGFYERLISSQEGVNTFTLT
jgi:hypothetical protein